MSSAPRKPEIEDANYQSRRAMAVSASTDLRRSLLRVSEGMNLGAVACSDPAQAREALFRQKFALVFCDETLPDGTYRGLLAWHNPGWRRIPPVIAAMRDGAWEPYLETMRLGAIDAIGRPITPTDVELALLQAARSGPSGNVSFDHGVSMRQM